MEKPSDIETQLILDYDIKNAGHNNCVECVIDAWKKDCDTDMYNNSEQQMVQGLYEDFESEWNNGEDRAKQFLEHNEITLGIIRSIEELYKYQEEEFGDSFYKDTLEEKLDLVYYCEAEELLKKAVEEEELDMDYWG